MMISFQLQVAAKPDSGGLLIMRLEPWQRQILEQALTDHQRQLLEDGLVKIEAEVLAMELEDWLVT
jgi:hypothetical protein